ncbi:MAG: YbjN domain-containing protein [Sphingopyxis macrogoltabida]|uniref:YbjN domain-containing protein n=1 Tax=Sphingopyxis macrogoltabida TaxID=33050 RepID=A0A2W5L630_SPHMC|nr:MAG: YbjN domain-containing protein [Sphingopyxis macrogoltabida]
MRLFAVRAAVILASATLLAAAPARAELVGASDPAKIQAIVESQGWPARLISEDGSDPYIEATRNGLKFLVLFMNCEDGRDCKTLQYYMGFNDAKGLSLDRLNLWNKEKRFARAYRDDAGDPVLEMDVDLDFNGLPRENVGESFSTWAALMDSFRDFVYEK